MQKEPRYFTVKQFNRISFRTAHAIIKLRKERKLISKSLQKQIMLAVSEVNSCRVCSYVHTQALLKEGATKEELDALFSDNFRNLDEKEAHALLFAEHYADTLGNYDGETLTELRRYYSAQEVAGIIGTIQIIMFGNANGINLTNFVNRFRLKRNKNSKLGTELYNGFFAYLLLPFFLLINIFVRKRVI
ncbi:MAG TPA: carboxymuconolactone decarboxylase family protein [Bacilli bacterium]|nr:carboxymuconolactone decarboxylase family protein [Bacilli bacterium]